MSVITDYVEKAASLVAEQEDRVVQELLDKHGLKEVETAGDLEKMGYALEILKSTDIEGNRQMEVTLLKFVDKATCKVKINFHIEDTEFTSEGN